MDIKIKYTRDILPIEPCDVGDWIDLRAAENVYMQFTVNGETENVALTDAVTATVNGQECYVFTVKLAAKQIPPRVRSILNEIKKNQKANLYLSYAQLRRMFAKLSNSEKELVTDYIISIYYPFDTDALLSYYNSYEDMTYAMKSTAGSEYDIKEKFYYGSDTVYDEMSNYVENILQIKPVRLVTTLKDDVKFEVAKQLQKATMASTQQISKFLHLKVHKLGK